MGAGASVVHEFQSWNPDLFPNYGHNDQDEGWHVMLWNVRNSDGEERQW